MQTLMPLRTTDGLDKRGLGIGKKWLAKDNAHRELMWDLILKIVSFKTTALPNKKTPGGAWSPPGVF